MRLPHCARDRQETTAEQTKQCRITLIMQSADSAHESLPHLTSARLNMKFCFAADGSNLALQDRKIALV